MGETINNEGAVTPDFVHDGVLHMINTGYGESWGVVLDTVKSVAPEADNVYALELVAVTPRIDEAAVQRFESSADLLPPSNDRSDLREPPTGGRLKIA